MAGLLIQTLVRPDLPSAYPVVHSAPCFIETKKELLRLLPEGRVRTRPVSTAVPKMTTVQHIQHVWQDPREDLVQSADSYLNASTYTSYAGRNDQDVE